jgi:4-hydroxybenzoate polyprenyltransferase
MEADAMSATDDLEVEDTQALRARRLFQISSLTLAALAIGGLFYACSSRWLIVSILVGGMVLIRCRDERHDPGKSAARFAKAHQPGAQ